MITLVVNRQLLQIVADNVPNAMFDGDVFENPFAPPSTSAAESSSSQYVDPSNMHATMTDPAWIDSMEEDLLQFKRLDVWVLVPALDNIKPLTLKWLFKNKHDEENTVIRNKTHLPLRNVDDGGMTFFLGLQVNQSPRGIFINQSNYMLETLNKYGMETYDPIGTPTEIKDKLDLNQNGTLVDATKYRSRQDKSEDGKPMIKAGSV
ncbi:copia protein [Tanacetum coccineum]